jgi:hypothetical protein
MLFAAEGPALAPDYPDDVHRIRRLLLDPLAKAIGDGARQGSFALSSPDSAAVAIWLLTSSLMREPLAGGDLTASYENALCFIRDHSNRMLGARHCTAIADPDGQCPRAPVSRLHRGISVPQP